MRLHSEVPSGHEFWGNAVQPSMAAKLNEREIPLKVVNRIAWVTVR